MIADPHESFLFFPKMIQLNQQSYKQGECVDWTLLHSPLRCNNKNHKIFYLPMHLTLIK